MEKQGEASRRSIEWVELHPYEVMFMEQVPALPGDRAGNLKKSIEGIKSRAEKDAQYLADPKNLEALHQGRLERHVDEQFCWKE
ncbi:hypothetical protein [Hydrocarboniphaga sp.]|uniref:hypothetical protein n=1 Tax=Hydrocarboniphaga sp. TaxID=2033016 RepID=UPI00261F2CA2|nr:hypothetical protein [Hydrocarboniphaga sp.]